jgi:hypothetical protein
MSEPPVSFSQKRKFPFRYKDQLVKSVLEIMDMYSENHTEPTNVNW